MFAAQRHQYTYEEYLQALTDSHIKLEYWAGEIYAMAGGTRDHGALAAKMIALCDSQLSPQCRMYTSDVRIRIDAADVTVFPDGSIVCGSPQSFRGDRDTLMNPSLVVEVISPSSENYDRGDKLKCYQMVPSLTAVCLIASAEPRITLVERTEAEWKTTEFGAGQTLTVSSPALRISVDQLYRVVERVSVTSD